jgi:hypothetical protein
VWCFYSLASSYDALDRQVVQFIEYLWAEGQPKSLAADTLSGIQHLLLRKHILDGSWKLYGAWGKSEWPARAPPLTMFMVGALANLALLDGRTDYASLLLVGFHCFLRTMEMLGLHSTSVSIDDGGAGVLHLGETKSGKRKGAEEMVTTLDPSVIGLLTMLLRSQKSPGPLLCSSPRRFRLWFSRALERRQLAHYNFKP